MAIAIRPCMPLRFSAWATSPPIASPYQSSLRYLHGRRNLHESNSKKTVTSSVHANIPSNPGPMVAASSSKPPLSILPFATLLRSYLITALSSSPFFLNSSLWGLGVLARSKSVILSPDRNPMLHFVIKKTIYAQFCAGETAKEVEQATKCIKSIGFGGVILGHAREVVLQEGESIDKIGSITESSKADIKAWRRSSLETLKMLQPGDFAAFKFTGAGSQVLSELKKSLPPNKDMESAILDICQSAKAKNLRILLDAEQHALQAGIDAWCIDFQERFNRDVPGQALVYGTYQAYKRSTPEILAKDLSVAKERGFTLGVKLVRGAYLGSDPRHLFWSTKEETDKAYNEITESLMRRTYTGMLKPVQGKEIQGFPEVNLMLATHNFETVRKAIAIREDQLKTGTGVIPMAYGQLQGMADNVSCELVHAGKVGQGLQHKQSTVEAPKAYKFLVWGSVGECLHYLLRRAQENRDAVTRTEESRLALRGELGRRALGA